MTEQAQTQTASAPPLSSRKFLVIDIEGDRQLVDSYCDLFKMQIETSIEFYRAMFMAGGKRKSKLPTVQVHERQAE
jgi:hypothetical protein